MSEFRVTFRGEDGRERAVTVRAHDRAEAIGRASAAVEAVAGGPRRGRVSVRVEPPPRP
jgi:hypothetical protein